MLTTRCLAISLALGFIAAPAHGQPRAACTERAASSAEAIRPLLPGMRVPDVALTTVASASPSLAAALDGKPTVVVFYRGGWCPFCNVQLGALQTVLPDLEKLGLRVVAMSPDRPEKLAPLIAKHHLGYTLLSDSSMCAAQAFGVSFRVEDGIVERYRSMQMDLEGDSGERHHLLPVPSVFIVDADGTVRFSYANPDYKVRLDPQVLLAAARTPVWRIAPKRP